MLIRYASRIIDIARIRGLTNLAPVCRPSRLAYFRQPAVIDYLIKENRILNEQPVYAQACPGQVPLLRRKDHNSFCREAALIVILAVYIDVVTKLQVLYKDDL